MALPLSATLKVNIPIIRTDRSGSVRNVTLYLGTCEANRTKPNSEKLVMKNLSALYDNVLQNDFDCVVEEHKEVIQIEAEENEKENMTLSSVFKKGKEALAESVEKLLGKHPIVIDNEYKGMVTDDTTNETYVVKKISPTLPEETSAKVDGDSVRVVDWDIVKRIASGSIMHSKDKFYQRLLGLSMEEKVHYDDMDNVESFAPQKISDMVIFILKSMLHFDRKRKKQIVKIWAVTGGGKGLHTPDVMVEGCPYREKKAIQNNSVFGILSCFHFVDILEFFAVDPTPFKDFYLDHEEKSLEFLTMDEVTGSFQRFVTEKVGGDPFNGLKPNNWGSVKKTKGKDSNKEVKYIPCPQIFDPDSHIVPFKFPHLGRVGEEKVKFVVTDSSMAGRPLIKTSYAYAHNLYCYKNTGVKCTSCYTEYDALFLTKNSKKTGNPYECKKQHHTEGCEVSLVESVTPEMLYDKLKLGVMKAAEENMETLTPSFTETVKNRELEKIKDRLFNKEDTNYVHDIYTINSDTIQEMLQWDIYDNLSVDILVSEASRQGVNRTRQYSLFIQIACLDLNHIDWVLKGSGTGKDKEDKDDSEKSFEMSSQEQTIENYITAFTNRDPLNVKDIETSTKEVSDQNILPELEIWTRVKQKEFLLKPILEYRTTLGSRDTSKRITVKEFYCGLAKPCQAVWGKRKDFRKQIHKRIEEKLRIQSNKQKFITEREKWKTGNNNLEDIDYGELKNRHLSLNLDFGEAFDNLFNAKDDNVRATFKEGSISAHSAVEMKMQVSLRNAHQDVNDLTQNEDSSSNHVHNSRVKFKDSVSSHVDDVLLVAQQDPNEHIEELVAKAVDKAVGPMVTEMRSFFREFRSSQPPPPVPAAKKRKLKKQQNQLA